MKVSLGILVLAARLVKKAIDFEVKNLRLDSGARGCQHQSLRLDSSFNQKLGRNQILVVIE